MKVVCMEEKEEMQKNSKKNDTNNYIQCEFNELIETVGVNKAKKIKDNIYL